MNKVLFFTYDGKSPFKKWLLAQDPMTAARIRNTLARMEAGNRGDYKILFPGLYETRLFFGSGYRIYYTVQNGQLIIILGAGNKKTQTKDIALAKKYLSMLQEGRPYDKKK